METFGIRKVANAFVPDATVSDLVFGPALYAVARFWWKHGGLWVGGTVDISHNGISFSPNGLNRPFHVGLEPISVPSGDIRSVRYEFGWFTGIVIVEHQRGEFRFRCYGAKQVAAIMAARFNAP